MVPDLLREQFNIEDRQISAKAIYFGVMAFATLSVLKHRDDYTKVDLDEVIEVWHREALYPIESLNGYDFLERINII